MWGGRLSVLVIVVAQPLVVFAFIGMQSYRSSFQIPLVAVAVFPHYHVTTAY